VKLRASASAVDLVIARSQVAPPTTISGGPSPSRSKAIVVASGARFQRAQESARRRGTSAEYAAPTRIVVVVR
jgi:hypothetical protein